MKFRRRFRKSRFRRRRGVYSIAKRAASKVLGRYIRNKVEVKYLSLNATTNPSYNGSLNVLSSISQGDTDSSRDGDACFLTSLTFHYSINVNTTATYNQVRVVLFRWNVSTDLAAATSAQIMDNPGFSNTPLSNYVMDSQRQKRFKILYSKLHSVYSNGRSVINKAVHLKLKSKLSFSGGSADARGHIYALFLSGDSPGANPPFVQYASKVNFTDS